MEFNPIFKRELCSSVRDPKIVILVMGLLGILGAILLFLWPSTGVYSQATDSSRQLFGIFLMSNLALIILLVPALTSPSITSERENKSYELLFTSLLTPGAILRGKLASSISMILLVVLVSMPLSALCALSGGISMNLLWRAFSIILMSALTYGILGLAISALCKSTFTSLVLSYVAVAFFAGSTWLPSYLLRSRLLAAPNLLIRCLSPFDAMWSVLYPQRYQMTQVTVFTDNPDAFYYIYLLGNGVLLLFFLIIFCRYVISAPRPHIFFNWAAGFVGVLLLAIGSGQAWLVKTFDLSLKSVAPFVEAGDMEAFSTMVDGAFLDPSLFVLLAVLIDAGLILIIFKLLQKSRRMRVQNADQAAERDKQPALTKPFLKRGILGFFMRIFGGYMFSGRKRPIGRFRNPIFLAEMRSKVFAKPVFLIYGLVGCMSISMVLLILTCMQFGEWLSPDRVRLTAIVFQVGIIAILAPAISSGAITDEIVGHTLLMLRMTPIPATRIVMGKLKAAFLYVSIFLVSSLPVLFSLAYLDYSKDLISLASFWRVGAWLAILVVVTICFITAGLCASAFSRTTSVATAISYCFAAVICIVTLAALIPDAMPVKIQDFLLTVNPIIAALRVTSDEMFSQLPDNVWIHNLVILGSIAIFFVLAASARVYRIFTRRT